MLYRRSVQQKGITFMQKQVMWKWNQQNQHAPKGVRALELLKLGAMQKKEKSVGQKGIKVLWAMG